MTIHRYTDFFGCLVPWYSICISVAVVVMAIRLYFCGIKGEFKNEDENKLLIFFPLALVFGIIPAFGFDVLFRETWRTWGNGLRAEFGFAFFGWASGVLFFSYVWGVFSRLGGKKLFDFFAPNLAIAQCFGRIGCFLGGCCYGKPSSFLGVHYPPGSLPHEKLGEVAVFPVQLFEAFFLALLFYGCVKAPKIYRGATYLTGVATIRFVMEYFRYDNRGTLFGLDIFSPSQCVSVILFIIGVSVFFYSKKKMCCR